MNMKEYQVEDILDELTKLNVTMERIADDLDTIIAGVTLKTLKGLGRGLLAFLDGVLDDANITNGKKG